MRRLDRGETVVDGKIEDMTASPPAVSDLHVSCPENRRVVDRIEPGSILEAPR
nr:3',5'-cyclic AMP phosphodiesterase CpdA [uncultured bacterium]